MELSQVLSIPFLFAFTIFIYMIVYYSKIPRTRYPPGPWKLPIIGNLHQLMGPLPPRSLRNLANKHGPVMSLQLGEVSAVVISSPKAAEEVMKTNDHHFLNRPETTAAKILTYGCVDIAFAPYGDYFRQIRKICALELLSPKRVQSYRYVREEVVNKVIRSISSSSGVPINLTETITTLTNQLTCRAAFGKGYGDGDRDFLAALKEIMSLGNGFDLPDLFPSFKPLHRFSMLKGRLEKVHVKVDNILNNIVDDHRAKMITRLTSSEDSGDEDLIDVLLRLQNTDLEIPITTNNIKAVILDIFTGGIDTTAVVLEWAMSELIKNPLVMKKVQAEVRHVMEGKNNVEESDIRDMSYLKLVIKETLRVHPPLSLIVPREANETCQINGYTVTKKTKIIINAWAIGRDEKYWTNAELFVPDRFIGSPIDFKGTNFEYIPFGSGRRICPGISFANANIELVLAQLLYHFNWKLPNEMKAEDIDMTEHFGVALRRKTDLCLIAIPYISSV